MDPRARPPWMPRASRARARPPPRSPSSSSAGSDLVVALDRGHRADLRRIAPRRADVALLRWWSEGIDLDVPDPYYGDAAEDVRA